MSSKRGDGASVPPYLDPIDSVRDLARLTPKKRRIDTKEHADQELRDAFAANKEPIESTYRIAVLTVDQEAHDAMHDQAEKVDRPSKSINHPIRDANRYHIAKFGGTASGRRRKHYIVWPSMTETGPEAASSVATAMLMSFPKIEEIIVVGICAGVPNLEEPDRDVHLGDIVVSRYGIVKHDSIKLRDGKYVYEGAPVKPSPSIMQILDEVQSTFRRGMAPWDAYIADTNLKGASRPDDSTDTLFSPASPPEPIVRPACGWRRAGRPLVILGRVGSGGVLIEDEVYRDRVARDLDLQAIEMEAAGVVQAIRSTAGVAHTFTIRGASDYGSFPRRGDWRAYAALAAVSYLRAVLGRMDA